jgi:hypothetical protein
MHIDQTSAVQSALSNITAIQTRLNHVQQMIEAGGRSDAEIKTELMRCNIHLGDLREFNDPNAFIEPVPALTNFQRVSRFNTIASNGYGKADWKKLGSQMNIIQKERDELDLGFNRRHLEQMLDAAADELVTVYGLFHLMGVNGDTIFNEVANALETRFDTTMDDAQKTVQKYLDMGVET